jgi:hypothetical protein
MPYTVKRYADFLRAMNPYQWVQLGQWAAQKLTVGGWGKMGKKFGCIG